MKKTLLLILVVSLFFSCSSFMYYPPAANAPLFTEKDELKVSAGLKGYAGYVRSAYSVSNHIAFQLNANLLNLKVTELSTEYLNSNLYAESAVGVYFPFAKHFVAECYLGGGLGITGANNLTNDILTLRNHGRVYLQGNIGYRSKYFEAGLVLKEALVAVYKERVNASITANQYLDSFLESLVFIAVGGEKFKVNLQAGLSYSQFSVISYAPFIISLGVETRFLLLK
jgi:hypothetical protein